MVKNIYLSEETRNLVKEYSKLFKMPMHVVVYKFLQLYQYSSNYAKEYDTKGNIICRFKLPIIIEGMKTNLQIGYPNGDWYDFKREAILRNIPLHELIDRVLLLVARDTHEINKQLHVKMREKGNE